MSLLKPSRGETWFLNLDPIQGREQAWIHPALVISVDAFNHGPADLLVVLPVTSKAKGIPFHVTLAPPEGLVRQPELHQMRGRSFRLPLALARALGISGAAYEWRPSKTGCGF